VTVCAPGHSPSQLSELPQEDSLVPSSEQKISGLPSVAAKSAFALPGAPSVTPVIKVFGAVVSTVKAVNAGVGSVIPASVARARTVCGPGARPVSSSPSSQPVYGPSSSEQAIVAPSIPAPRARTGLRAPTLSSWKLASV